MALAPRRISTRGPQDGRAAELSDDSFFATGAPMTKTRNGRVYTRQKSGLYTAPGEFGEHQNTIIDQDSLGLTPKGWDRPIEQRDIDRGRGKIGEMFKRMHASGRFHEGPDSMVPKVSTVAPRPQPQLQARLPARAPVAREAARTVGEGQALPGVSGRLSGLLSRESPYIQRARTRAAQLANRRGLGSSSLAAGAGEAAAIDAALPIAQADAQIAANERLQRSQEFMQARQLDLQEVMQQRDHRVQQLMQTQRLDHDSAQRQADREFQSQMQAAQFAFQEAQGAVQREFAAAQAGLGREFAASQAGLGRAFTGSQAALDRETQRIMQERGITATEAREAAQREFAGVQAALDRETQRIMQDRGISAEDARQEAARELSGRIAVSTAVQNAQDTFNSRLTAISNNPNIPAEERAEMISRAERQRDERLSLIEQTHNVDLDWTTAA